MPKIKNIIIFLVIAIIFVLIYIYFIKGSPNDSATLVSSSPNETTSEVLPSTNTTVATENNSAVAQEFLAILLNVKDIKLNDKIFSDIAFTSLHDSSIILVPDGNEGRINPFAPIGADPDTILPPNCTLPKILNIATNTCITPPPICTLPKVLNPSTNTCVTPITCTLPKVINPSTNTCVTPLSCTSPKVLDISTNTCVNPPAN